MKSDDQHDPWAEAAARRRAAAGQTIGDELSASDPDLDDVPPELVALDGKPVTITGRDPASDRLNMADGMIVIVPALFARARRAREDDEA